MTKLKPTGKPGKRWREILLIEDNSARAERRPIVGVASPPGNALVTVRVHRIRAANCEIVAQKTYRPGALKHRAKKGGKAAVALELIDGVRLRPKGTVVAAGPVYGCNAWFLAGLAERDLDYIVEVRPSTKLHRASGPTVKRSQAAAAFLGSAKWQSLDIHVPGAAASLAYSTALLAGVRLPDGQQVRLFAAQTGGILGVHRGTILGISSDRSAEPGDLLPVVGWTRWIRPATRGQERKALGSAPAQREPRPGADHGVNGTQLTVRANITLASRQDKRAAWHHEALPLHASPLRRQLASASPVLNVVELFAGAGAMGLGFLLAGGGRQRYRIVFSGEVNPIYVETLRNNHNEIAKHRRGDRADHVPERLEPIDLRTSDAITMVRRSAREAGGVQVLVGGPPCQGFSNANRNSWHSSNPHNRLMEVFLHHVEALRPPVFLLENVQGILWTPKSWQSSASPTVVNHLARRMAAAGYEVFPKLLDAVWYGVPQYRSRFFLLGLRRDLGYRKEDFGQWGPFPLPTHGPGCSRPYVTVSEAISDLPPVGNGEWRAEQEYQTPSASELRSNRFLELMRGGAPQGIVFDHITSRHADYVIERYRRIPQGGNWQDIADKLTNYADVERTHSNIYRRLNWSEPSITIGHYRKSMLVHPSQHRGLSVREASRLQSVPDWFRFAGSANSGTAGLVHKQQQLANAVCPLVTMALADFILNL